MALPLIRVKAQVLTRNPGTSLLAQMVKNQLAMQAAQVPSEGQEDPTEKETAILSSILAWGFPWTEEPDGLQSMGLPRVGHNWVANTFTFTSLLVTMRPYMRTHRHFPPVLISLWRMSPLTTTVWLHWSPCFSKNDGHLLNWVHHHVGYWTWSPYLQNKVILSEDLSGSSMKMLWLCSYFHLPRVKTMRPQT